MPASPSRRSGSRSISRASLVRTPRAGIDPVATDADALALLDLVISQPPRHEVIAFLLDDSSRGLGCLLVVSDTADADAVLTVADTMAEVAMCHEAAGGSASSLVIATVRPDRDLLDDDDERWRRLSDLTEDRGLVVREWFVFGPAGIWCPRQLTGEPDRWPR